MEAKLVSANKERKIKRKEVLEKKKVVADVIKAASTVKDHLVFYTPFRNFNRNGLSVQLESGFGDRLSSSMKSYIMSLLKTNMEGPYGPEWPAEEKIKRREMVSSEARYIFLRESNGVSFPKNTSNLEGESTSSKWTGDGDNIVGFLHYRFTVEEDVPVVYIYELQLESFIQGKGLGKFLMQLLELISHKNRMGAVVLTVLKSNVSAMKFYTEKLGYTISAISPSKVDLLIGIEMNYEILCKTFDQEAKAKLEGEKPRTFDPDHGSGSSIRVEITSILAAVCEWKGDLIRRAATPPRVASQDLIPGATMGLQWSPSTPVVVTY